LDLLPATTVGIWDPEGVMQAHRRSSSSVHHYRAFGLHLRSEVLLPELSAIGPSAQPPQIEIEINDAGNLCGPHYCDGVSSIVRDDYLLNVPDVARYRVSQGRKIVVEPCRKASEESVRAYLLGTALGVCCHQRDLLPLHASAIVVGDRAVGFAGRSGAGKSTLAALFRQRGYAVLADDISVVSFADDGQPLIWPGVPRLKLRGDAAATLGVDDGTAKCRLDDAGKYQIDATADYARAPRRFDRLYVLDAEPDGQGPERASGARSVALLLENTYRQFVSAPMGHASAHFANVVSLLGKIDVYAVRWRLGLSRLAPDAAALESHFTRGSDRVNGG
jgi:hypothetical protein